LQCEMVCKTFFICIFSTPVRWSIRPLPSCIYESGRSFLSAQLVPETIAIMHFFHNMGSWKYFDLTGNVVIDWKLFN
jgi:hypothetical protein